MKEKVYKAIQRSGNNGIRLRDIGYVVNAWHCGLLEYVSELIQEKKIYGKIIGHGWQAYIKYYTVGTAPKE